MIRVDLRAARACAFSALTAVALSACASSDVSKISGASPDQIRQVSVSAVNVAVETPQANPGLQAALKDELSKAMQVCATGITPHSMTVTVTDFEDQNVAKSILIGDEIELAGRVELFDDATGGKTGEYFVERSFFWGGFIGAAMMSDAEASLSEAFAESVCEEVFGVELEN